MGTRKGLTGSTWASDILSDDQSFYFLTVPITHHNAPLVATAPTHFLSSSGETIASQGMACNSTRLRALALYKELHRLGRDYPDPSYNFHARIRNLFESRRKSISRFSLAQLQYLIVPENRHLTDKQEIENAFKLGEYIKKETLALYSLRKYRHLKRMYPDSMSDPQ